MTLQFWCLSWSFCARGPWEKHEMNKEILQKKQNKGLGDLPLCDNLTNHFFKTFQTWHRYLGLIWYLELCHIVRVEAGSAYMTRPGRTTSWNGVKLNHLLPTTASKQVMRFVMTSSQQSWKKEIKILHFVCLFSYRWPVDLPDTQ